MFECNNVKLSSLTAIAKICMWVINELLCTLGFLCGNNISIYYQCYQRLFSHQAPWRWWWWWWWWCASMLQLLCLQFNGLILQADRLDKWTSSLPIPQTQGPPVEAFDRTFLYNYLQLWVQSMVLYFSPYGSWFFVEPIGASRGKQGTLNTSGIYVCLYGQYNIVLNFNYCFW
jgi:hypothetical protein